MWCALAGGVQWVGQPWVTIVHFGPCICLGLWLLTTDHDNSDSFSTTLESRLQYLPLVSWLSQNALQFSISTQRVVANHNKWQLKITMYLPTSKTVR